MFIINLKRTGIINMDHCLALKQLECRVCAITEQHHPDCPHYITLAEYSTVERAKQEFDKLLDALRMNKTYYEMAEEKDAK